MTDFKSEKYKKVIEANNRRNEISAKVNTKWTPLDECVHTQLHEAEVNDELTKAECFNAIVEGMKILGWDKENHEK